MMDTDEMVRMAKEREGWEAVTKYPDFPTVFSDSSDYALEIAPLREGRVQDANFIAHAPRTILALAERVRELEVRCAALGEWRQAENELPPIDYCNEEPQFVYEESVEVEGLITVPIHLCRWTYKDGTDEIVWDNKRSNVRHRNIIGWKPLPKP